MQQRILSLDVARGFTVFFIAPIHVVMLYSIPSVHDSWLGVIFSFIAEWPGAQLFMTLMGISFYLSDKKGKTIDKAFQLLLAGYALNVYKFVLPYLFNVMPFELLNYLDVAKNEKGLLQLLLVGDILQFGGLALMFLYFLSKLSLNPILNLILVLAICLCSPFVWDLTNNNYCLQYLFELIGGQPPHVFFPVFSWIVYPLTGLIIGHYIKRGFYISRLWLPGILFVLLGAITEQYFIPCNQVSFYRTCPAETFYHIGFILIWLAGCDILCKKIKANGIFTFLNYLSKHITLLYVIQWLIIFGLLPLVGYQQQDFKLTLVLMFIITINVLGYVFIINELKK